MIAHHMLEMLMEVLMDALGEKVTHFGPHSLALRPHTRLYGQDVCQTLLKDTNESLFHLDIVGNCYNLAKELH